VDHIACCVEQFNPDSFACIVGTNFRHEYIFRSVLRSEATYSNLIILSTRSGCPLDTSVATTYVTRFHIQDIRHFKTGSECQRQIFLYITYGSQRQCVFYIAKVFYVRSCTNIDLSSYVTTKNIVHQVVFATFISIRSFFCSSSQFHRFLTDEQFHFFCFVCSECEQVRTAQQVDFLFDLRFFTIYSRTVMRQVTTLDIEYRVFRCATVYNTELECFDLILTCCVRAEPYFRNFHVTLDTSCQRIVYVDSVRSPDTEFSPSFVIESQITFVIIQVEEVYAVVRFCFSSTLLRSQTDRVFRIVASPHALFRTTSDCIDSHFNTVAIFRIELSRNKSQYFTIFVRRNLNLCTYCIYLTISFTVQVAQNCYFITECTGLVREYFHIHRISDVQTSDDELTVAYRIASIYITSLVILTEHFVIDEVRSRNPVF